MADLKTEQGITAELQKQKALLSDIDSRTKAGLKLKEKIIALEEKLVKVQNTISQQIIQVTPQSNFSNISQFTQTDYIQQAKGNVRDIKPLPEVSSNITPQQLTQIFILFFTFFSFAVLFFKFVPFFLCTLA